MVALRFSKVFVCLAVLLVPLATLSSQEGKEGKGRDKERDGLIARIRSLIPPAAMKELNLSAEQQTKLSQLEQEFKDHRRNDLGKTAVKVMAMVKDLENEEDEAIPVLAILHEVTGGLIEARKSRIAFDKKVEDLLTPEQKTKWADLRERQAPDRRDFRKSDERARDGLQILQIGQRLKLNPDQVKRIGELRIEIEGKVRAMLNDEQKRMFDELKNLLPDRRERNDQEN